MERILEKTVRAIPRSRLAAKRGVLLWRVLTALGVILPLAVFAASWITAGFPLPIPPEALTWAIKWWSPTLYVTAILLTFGGYARFSPGSRLEEDRVHLREVGIGLILAGALILLPFLAVFQFTSGGGGVSALLEHATLTLFLLLLLLIASWLLFLSLGVEQKVEVGVGFFALLAAGLLILPAFLTYALGRGLNLPPTLSVLGGLGMFSVGVGLAYLAATGRARILVRRITLGGEAEKR